MTGVKGRSGRKRNITNVLKYLTDKIDENWYELVDRLIERALNGDKEALFYCVDRRVGKLKTEIDLTGGEQLGTGLILQVLKMVQERKQLTEGDYAIQGQAETERLLEEQKEEAEDVHP